LRRGRISSETCKSPGWDFGWEKYNCFVITNLCGNFSGFQMEMRRSFKDGDITAFKGKSEF
jgi:hypothetical protein